MKKLLSVICLAAGLFSASRVGAGWEYCGPLNPDFVFGWPSWIYCFKGASYWVPVTTDDYSVHAAVDGVTDCSLIIQGPASDYFYHRVSMPRTPPGGGRSGCDDDIDAWMMAPGSTRMLSCNDSSGRTVNTWTVLSYAQNFVHCP
jgi:hypothetical protein